MIGVIAVGLCVLLAIAVLALARSLGRTQARLEASVAELRAAVEAQSRDIGKVDELLERADKISSRVESTSRTLAAPVIKAMAIGAGTKSAAQRFRRGQNGS